MSELDELAILHCLGEINARNGWVDPDNLCGRFASLFRVSAPRIGTPRDIARTLQSLKTYFFTRNRISREKYAEIVHSELQQIPLGVVQASIYEEILAFKELVERQGIDAFRYGKAPQEVVGQTMLQFWIEQFMRHTGLKGRTFTEVPSGGGEMDLLIIVPEEETVVEIEIWRGQKNHAQHLGQIADYLETEGARATKGIQVVFDNTERGTSLEREKGSTTFKERCRDYLIEVVMIKINPQAPSRRSRSKT